MTKLKMWQPEKSWEHAEKEWDAQACVSAKQFPIKKLNALPQMVGITKETAKHLKWKSLYWMVTKDHGFQILKGFLRHPLKYAKRLVQSAFKQKPYLRDKDFFFYGVKDLTEFKHLLENKDHLFILGFSYCHKPFECPSGRFTDQCIHDPAHPVCQQCFIGKAVNATACTRTIPLFIPTIHYIGGKIFEIAHQYPHKQILFMITACEMTLEMFGDWGNMVDIKGVGVRLDGRICNTMKAFELSETGIKPGLTVVLEETQKQMLEILKLNWQVETKNFKN